MSAFDDPEVCRAILESLPTGLCVVDMQKRVVLWSAGAERITGRSRNEVIGHSCIAEALLHCDQPGCEFCGEDCALARAIKTAQPTEASGILHHKAGHQIAARVRAVPVHNEHGSIIGAVEIFDDPQSTDALDPREEGLKVAGWVDEVTGVASHIGMQSHLRDTLTTYDEVRIPFGLLLFRLEGLDHFRASFGPEAASLLLRVVARTLEGALWRTDFVGRWSQDKFLVILNGCQEEALCSVRERLRRMLANDAIEWWGERHSLPVSIGQATPQLADTMESLMDRAQKSLDAASNAVAKAAASAGQQGSRG